MRAILLILIIGIVAVLAAVASGFVNIDQVRGARAPEVSTTGNGVSATGGQAPAFDVETGSIKVGSAPANVKLPTFEVRPPSNDSETRDAQANNSM